MTSEDYIKLVKRTESPTFGDINQRIMHGVVGCVTESGEMMDAVKKCLFYDRRLDTDNLKEEIGDVFWYLGILCDQLGVTFEEIQSMNIRKLQKRYPDQFKDVVVRDYEGEMEAAKEPDKFNCACCDTLIDEGVNFCYECGAGGDDDSDDEKDEDFNEEEAAKEPDKPIDQQNSQLPKCFGQASKEKEDQKCFGCLSRGPCVRETLQHIPPKEEERPVPRCWD